MHQYAATLAGRGGLNLGGGLSRCEEGTFSPEDEINPSLK